MPVIKVWCLPPDESEEELRQLHKTIVAAVVGVPLLECTNEADMIVLFIPDMMKYGLGEEIVIEVTGVLDNLVQFHPSLGGDLIKVICTRVKEFYRGANKVKKVKGFFQPTLPSGHFCWYDVEED